VTGNILDLPIGPQLDPDELVRAAMEWHFGPETGSEYWLRKAETLPFDPRADVKTMQDLALFPNVLHELSDVRVEDLIPRGYGRDPGIVGVYESGGTTGVPKRLVLLRDWWDKHIEWVHTDLDAKGFPRNGNWLVLMPSGPHFIGEAANRLATDRGGLTFPIDMDPRWVKKLRATGQSGQAGAYAEHLVEQAAFLLRTQDIAVLSTTPPLLERIAGHDALVGLINEKVGGILWAGAHMDPDSRHLFRTEVFPGVPLSGIYGSTTILGGANERPELTNGDLCVFDPPAPFITFRVVDPDTGQTVDYGERGQVVMNHVSKNLLLPNSPELDIATRVKPTAGQAGDSVADVAPSVSFAGADVHEGVY
jgi:phenylacetate-coenzyme A ligase PaaK-like adenylate-forming protein